jgi:hypothetical protein
MNEKVYFQCRRGYYDEYGYIMEDVGQEFWTIDEARRYVNLCPPIGRYHIFEIKITETEVL